MTSRDVPFQSDQALMLPRGPLRSIHGGLIWIYGRSNLPLGIISKEVLETGCEIRPLDGKTASVSPLFNFGVALGSVRSCFPCLFQPLMSREVLILMDLPFTAHCRGDYRHSRAMPRPKGPSVTRPNVTEQILDTPHGVGNPNNSVRSNSTPRNSAFSHREGVGSALNNNAQGSSTPGTDTIGSGVPDNSEPREEEGTVHDSSGATRGSEELDDRDYRDGIDGEDEPSNRSTSDHEHIEQSIRASEMDEGPPVTQASQQLPSIDPQSPNEHDSVHEGSGSPRRSTSQVSEAQATTHSFAHRSETLRRRVNWTHQISQESHPFINVATRGPAFATSFVDADRLGYLNLSTSTLGDFSAWLELADDAQACQDRLLGPISALFMIPFYDTIDFLRIVDDLIDDITELAEDSYNVELHIQKWRRLLDLLSAEFRQMSVTLPEFGAFLCEKGIIDRSQTATADPVGAEIDKARAMVVREIDKTSRRLDMALQSLMNSLSIAASQRSIEEAEGVTKLTELGV
jgi:hypothetical protein